jgi:hypothetical protein
VGIGVDLLVALDTVAVEAHVVGCLYADRVLIGCALIKDL